MSVEGESWIGTRITDLEVSFLERIFTCETPEAVEAAVTYAAYLASVGVHPETCPVFLRLLEIRNSRVVEALVGKQDPYQVLSVVQPNKVLLSHIYETVGRWPRGGVHPKNLAVVLGVLKSVYAAPRQGYRLYPVSLPELNSVAKHLEKQTGQNEPNNRAILFYLDKLSTLDSDEDPEMDRIAVQSAAIRNAFFDDRRKMEDVIPEVILGQKTVPREVSPRQSKPIQDAAPRRPGRTSKKR